MPGIYVRKAKWIDWVQQKENPVLTVPGSYWLCHKDNIYKFIFRYHRTTRNIAQFNYGRELMKVIRRIIKNQPRQGQQFGTSHLLVTYNYTSWTRQDKIFAMLKFKERSVVAFSHAFILTIKILFSIENAEQNTNCATQFPLPVESANRSDEESACVNGSEKKGGRESKCLTHPSRSDFSQKRNEYNVQDKALERENKSIALGNNLIVNNLKKTSTNEQSAKDAPNCKDISKVIKVSKIGSEVVVMHDVSPENNTKFNNKTKEKLKKEHRNQNANSKNSTLLNSSVYKVEENEVISNGSSNWNCLGEKSIKNNCMTRREANANDIKSSNDDNKLFEVHEYITENDFTEYKSVSNTNKLLRDNTMDATSIDSINLPYQYLMEKEVEDAKQRILNSNKTKNDVALYNKDEQSSIKHKLEEMNEKRFIHPAEVFTNAVKTKDWPSPKRRKLSSDNMTSRSSDITDLVMEGLMFTIRQGQDTVAVIEQKTKLEVDEVLENSEKIETTKGEKCLRNSSLLGLENLITMIELPNRTEAKHKCQSTIVQENVLESQSTSKLLLSTSNGITQQNAEPYLKYTQWQSNTTSVAGASFTNNNEDLDKYDEHEYDKNMKIMENEDLEYEEEEEDIVPEALQDEIFQSSTSQERDKPNDKLDVMANIDLLMDDADAEESFKPETLISPLGENLLSRVRLKKNCSDNNIFTKSHEISVKSTISETHEYSSQHRSNVPIIVSNEIITPDQIPLPLQKILGNKSPTTNTFTNSRSEVNKHGIETSKQQSCQEENISFNAQLEGHASDSNTLQNTQYLENSQTRTPSINEVHADSTSSVMSDLELKNVNTTACNLKLNKEKPQKQNFSTDKAEHLLPNKIQDITHEFCQELSYLQKKKDLLDQKCLRSRRSLKDTDDGEVRIEMVKFFHDITRGAKVVVTRMSTKSIHRILGKSSSLATCMQY